MAKRKKTSEAPQPIDGADVVVFKALGFPELFVDGRVNPGFFQFGYAKLIALTFNEISTGQRIPFNAESVMLMLDRMAKSYGLDPKNLKDQRTPEQIVSESIDRLITTPAEIWELVDDEIAAVEKAMNDADTLTLDFIESERKRAEREEPEKKLWRSRLERIQRLRLRARQPTPPYAGADNANPLTRPFLEASWPLRMMAYCGRSNMSELLDGDPAKSVYRFGYHHAKMAGDFWVARREVAFEVPHDKDTLKVEVCIGAASCNGCILVCPFGHGKSDMGRFLTASWFVENPYTQAGINHAVADKAWENLKYLSALFSKSTPVGRRCVSLFGLESETSSQKEFRLKMPDRLKSPSAWAAGVDSGVLGGNTNFQWWDDPVPMSDRDQEGDRKKRFQRLTGQWLSRMRGSKKWFLLITATLWHNDDAVAALIKLVKQGKANYVFSRQKCGGPHTVPKFEPLWEEMYPASELRKRFDQMRNPSLYAAAYESNPLAEERRIVKKLRLFDPSTEEHATFLQNSIKYMSLDPAATRGERSDLAGVLYAGLGTVRTEKDSDGRPVYSDEKRLRLIECDSIPATQSDLVQHVVNICQFKAVDYVLVETRSGFHGTADMFENYHGIDVIRLDPKNKNKEERLRAAAPAIENANADLGVYAVVEFPGIKRADGSLKLDPRFEQLAEEILDFGVCSTDHSLDACVNLTNFLMPDLGIGTGGIVSRTVLESSRRAADPALVKLLAGWEKKKENKNRIEDEEHQWLRGQDSWRMPRSDAEFPQG